MKMLEATGLSLRADFKAANEKVWEKEREISKQRLKAANSQLTLNREVRKLEQKLKDNDVQVKSLYKELAEARLKSEALKNDLEEATKAAKKAASDGNTAGEKLPSARETVPLTKKETATKERPSPKEMKVPIPPLYKKAADDNIVQLPLKKYVEPVPAAEREVTVATKTTTIETKVQETPVNKGIAVAQKSAPVAKAKKGTPMFYFGEVVKPPSRKMTGAESSSTEISPPE
jgi:seryl-tRNA synthetase